MENQANKIEKKKLAIIGGKKVKAAKAFKEWKTDYMRQNDEDLMAIMTE